MNETLDAAKEKALDVTAVLRERFSEGSESVKAYTIEKPAKALAIAFGVGVLIGWWIKRR